MKKCNVINCGKVLKEGDYVKIGEKRYCRECAVLIAQEELELLSSVYSSTAEPRKESTE